MEWDLKTMSTYTLIPNALFHHLYVKEKRLQIVSVAGAVSIFF